jgi:hypothetical protein
MCAHSSSASEIIEKLKQKLYPFIEAQFLELQKFYDTHPISLNASTIYDTSKKLQKEFESLKQLETEKVFTVVQEVFETKHQHYFKPSGNVAALLQASSQKEDVIRTYVNQLQEKVQLYHLADGHPLYSILYTFSGLYFDEKEKWARMLNSFNKSCACFVKANAKAFQLQ